MGSLTTRDMATEFIPVKRKMKGRDKYGKGEDHITLQINVTHKGKSISLGKFHYEDVYNHLAGGNTTLQDNLEELVMNKWKGYGSDRTLDDTAYVRLQADVRNDVLVAFGKRFKSASPYMMYYSNYE